MHWEHDQWQQLSLSLKARWDRLTHEDLAAIAGKRDELVSRLQSIYGLAPERAEADLRDWERHQEPIEPGDPTHLR